MSTENLRREARVDASIPVVLVRGRTETRLESTDVSYRGLFLRTSSPPALRSLVRLRIELPAGGFEAHAMVVHIVSAATVHAEGVGLQFWGFSGTERKVWEEFVRGVIEARRAALRPKPAATGLPKADGPPSGIRTLGGATPTAPIVVGDAQRGTRR